MLSGACNRCGLCCTAESEGRLLVCEFLSWPGTIGQSWATRCRVYEARVDGLPIRMLDATTGAFVVDATCAKDSAVEELVIIQRGIGRGCSLTVAQEG